MRIGMFTETYAPQVNGVVTSIQTLKAELEKLGHQVYIFTTTDPAAPKHESEDILRLPSIPFVNYEERRIVVRGLSEAVKLARNVDLDLIHTHTEFGAGFLGKMVAKRMNIPVVHTFHTMYEDYMHYIVKKEFITRPLIKSYSHFYLDGLDAIICPSQRVTDWLRSLGIKNYMRNISTGIYIDEFIREDITEEEIINLRISLGIHDDEIMLLSLSRVSYEKNIQTMIRGFKEIHEKMPNTKLVIAGRGPYLQDLKELTNDLGLNESVLFVGQVEHGEVAYYYKAADYFLSASTSESQGLTYAEAIAAGTQVIAARNVYLDELLNDPSLGVTFEGDDQFVPVTLNYLSEQIPQEACVLEEKLYEISSENFGRSVYAFYLDVLVAYSQEIRDKEQMSTRLKIQSRIPRITRLRRRRKVKN